MEKMTGNKTLRFCFFFLLFLVFIFPGFPAEASSQEASLSSLIEGYNSYREGDWASTALFLRRALSDPSISNAEAYYMLITSDIYSKDYSSAILDCDFFLQNYPSNSLNGNVEYQKGKALHLSGQNDSAVIVLSDFCHENPKSPLYPSGLYWIAECFYDDYDFDMADSLYREILDKYPDDMKAEDAEYKVNLIAQKNREQKLLYLLKMTGEEYLTSREDYERQLRQYQTEDMIEVRQQLDEALKRIKELESQSSDAVIYAGEDTSISAGKTSEVENAQMQQNNEALEILKEKAARLQSVLE